MKKAIIFDLWETLGTKNVTTSKTLREKFGIPKTENFMRLYEEAVQLHQWETEEGMAKNFLSKFNLEQKPESIIFIIELFRKGIIEATLFGGIRGLLIALKEKGYKLGLLSNTTIFEAVVLERLEIRNLFDAVVFSWHKGNLKPSHEAFDHILTELGVSAEDALFVDDTTKNIVSAESYGIQTIQFESVPQLVSKLEELAIL
jgi:FMN phosphatase YigB (HAD superfamily)